MEISRVAESAKLLENVFRSVNIALVNELKVIFDRMDIDEWEVIEAARSKPFASCPSTRGPVWAGTASRSIRRALGDVFKNAALFGGVKLVVDTRNLMAGRELPAGGRGS